MHRQSPDDLIHHRRDRSDNLPGRHSRTEVLYSEDRGQTTAQRFVQALRSDYNFNVVSSMVAKLRYEDDLFSGYDWRVTESLGYGRRLFDTDRVLLEVNAGPGGRHSRLNNGSREDEVILQAGGEFEWRFSPSASLSEHVTVESGEEGTVTESTTALKTRLIHVLAMKLSFSFYHNSKVPAGTKKTDIRTALTLVYDF